MSSNLLHLSIIYVNYKTCNLILDSIKSVKDNTQNINYEIIVVDNNSEDNSLFIIKKHYPEVIYIQSGENLGFGKANNLGSKQAKGECIIFLNPDTLLINNALYILFNYLVSSDDIAICGGNLYDIQKKPTTSFNRNFPSYIQELLSIFYVNISSLHHFKSKNFNYTQKPLLVSSIIGADLMIKKNVLDQIGGFDPIFFMNYEETELCYRVYKKGYKIVSVPDAKIIHLEGKSSYVKKSRLFYLYEGEFFYFYKVYSFKKSEKIFLLNNLKNNIRILQFYILFNRNRLNYWKIKKITNIEAFESFKNKINE